LSSIGIGIGIGMNHQPGIGIGMNLSLVSVWRYPWNTIFCNIKGGLNYPQTHIDIFIGNNRILILQGLNSINKQLIYLKVYLECHLLVTNLFHASLAILGPMNKKINLSGFLSSKSKSKSKFYPLILVF